jgi:arabinofuranan 3-O-arabinosyltransferase
VVDARSTRAFVFDSVVLIRSGGRLAIGAVTPALETGNAVEREIQPQDSADRVLLLRQNTNPGWTAQQGGRALDAVVLDGWQQGWLLDGDGLVEATFAPDRAYRSGLAAGLAAFLALLALTLLPLRRHQQQAKEPPPTTERRTAVWVCAMAVLAGSGLIAGWTGVVIGAVTAVVATWGLERWPLVAPWLLSAPCLGASVAYAITPWGSSTGWAGQDAWTSYVMLVPLVGVLVGATMSSPVRRVQMPFSRRAGRSTTR